MAAIFSACRTRLADRLVLADRTLAPADLGTRAQPEPRTEVLDGGEATQVGAELRQDLHHRSQAQPVDAREVHASPVGQGLTGIELLALLAAQLVLDEQHLAARTAAVGGRALRPRPGRMPAAWPWSWSCGKACRMSFRPCPPCRRRTRRWTASCVSSLREPAGQPELWRRKRPTSSE
jgi:hypothetical protein